MRGDKTHAGAAEGGAVMRHAPVHREQLWRPGRPVHVIETYPVGPLKPSQKLPCKYCYETHRNWWVMDPRDYCVEGLTILLCGECEHTSALENMDIPQPPVFKRHS